MKRPAGRSRDGIDEVALLRAWTDWNLRSMNEYLEALLKLSKTERRKDRGASWGSIQDIFLHVIEDYIWWFEQVPYGKPTDSESFVGQDLSEAELRQLTKRVNRSVHRVMDQLSARDLGRPLAVSGISGSGKPYKFTTCLADIIWHMVEEDLQHRGELNALFWQMDVDPPVRAWFSRTLSFTK